MKKLFVTLFLLSSLVASAQVKTGAETQLLHPYANGSKSIRELPASLRNQMAIDTEGTETSVRILAQVTEAFDASTLKAYGIVMGSQIDDIVTLRVPLQQLSRLDQCKEIVSYQVAHKMAPTINQTRFDTHTDSVQMGADGLPYPIAGENVIIGITDWGFDYSHPNFRKDINSNAAVDSNFRILRAWDHFRKKGPAPEGFDYGTEIIGCDSLMAYGGDTSNLYKYNSHGTHVAGIAAGRGSSAGYTGQAPKAELLMCSFGLNESDWIDAANWMKHVADREGKRLVINSSWGMYTFNALDGKSLLSRAINGLSLQGVVFVTSGGNNGSDKFHLSHTFEAPTMESHTDTLVDSMGTVVLDTMGNPLLVTTIDTIYDTVRSWSEWYPNGIGQAFVLWGEEGRPFKASFALSNNDTMIKSRWFDVTDAEGSGAMNHYLVTKEHDTVPYTVIWEKQNNWCNRPHIQMNVSRLNGYKLHMFVTLSDSADVNDSVIVHAWNLCLLENEAGNMGCAFEKTGFSGYQAGDDYYGIGEPACAEKTISVAAHTADKVMANGTFRPGALAYFSSWGPALGEGKKPEISAPGVNVISSISSFCDEEYPEVSAATIRYNGKKFIFSQMSGTSMSGPAVTGIVALMLSANPDLSVDQVREILFENARTDANTGDIAANGWHMRWGYGKADALKAVHTALLGVERPDKSDMPLVVYPNPSHGSFTLLTANARPMQMQVFDASGRLMLQRTISGETVVNTSGWNRGVYVVRLQDGRVSKIMVL